MFSRLRWLALLAPAALLLLSPTLAAADPPASATGTHPAAAALDGALTRPLCPVTGASVVTIPLHPVAAGDAAVFLDAPRLQPPPC
jgi:hypothetical protein